MKKTTKPCNSSHTITTARRTDNIPLICTSAGPIYPVHSQPMLLATEAMPEIRLHFCHFPAVFSSIVNIGYVQGQQHPRGRFTVLDSGEVLTHHHHFFFAKQTQHVHRTRQVYDRFVHPQASSRRLQASACLQFSPKI